MDPPAALDPVLSACLREVLGTAVPGSGAGTQALRAALDDLAVRAVVVLVTLGAEPGASLVQVTRAADPLAQWLALSCI